MPAPEGSKGRREARIFLMHAAKAARAAGYSAQEWLEGISEESGFYYDYEQVGQRDVEAIAAHVWEL